MKKLFIILTVCALCSNSSGQCNLKLQSDWGKQLNSTGSDRLDELLNKEFITLCNVFNINNFMHIYEGNNASAIRERPIINVGKSMMLDELVKTNGTKSIIAILAHEFGHSIQYKNNMDVDVSWGGKWCELHADYMAGWYMGMKQYFSNEKLSKEEFYKVVYSFYEKGDSNDPWHHGTEYERSTAFLGGYYAATNKQFDLNTSYLKGQEYVINIDKMVGEYYPDAKKSNNSSNLNNNTNSTKAGYLCLYGNSKKALKAELFLGDQYVGSLSNYVIGSAPNYGENGTISLKVPPGNYQIGIKWPSGVFGRNYTIKFKYINVQSNYVTKLLVSDED
jgi:hypothetical protein